MKLFEKSFCCTKKLSAVLNKHVFFQSGFSFKDITREASHAKLEIKNAAKVKLDSVVSGFISVLNVLKG